MALGRSSAARLALAAVVAAAAALAGCESATPEAHDVVVLPAVPCTAATATATTNVILGSVQFLPYCTTVPVGVAVTFTNADFDEHTVTADQGQPVAFESGLLYPGQRFSFTFSKPETVRVHCRLHPQAVGVVIVQ